MNHSDIRQTEAAECGLACLAISSAILGARFELSELRRRFPVSSRGLTLHQLMETAGALDLTSRPVKCTVEELRQVQTPAILHWGLNHFVVLLKVRSKKIVIQDPGAGRRDVSWKDVDQKFTGVALEIRRAPTFARRKDRSPLKITSLIRFTPGIWNGLTQTLILSLLLQAYVVASPFYMQLAIDEAALKGDLGFLKVLAIGFGLFALFNVVASALRGLALQKLSALIGWDMTGRLFHHMLRLPLPWFQRRRLADAFARFESIEPVRALFSNGLVGSLIDGSLAIVTLIMMIIYAWKLALVAVAGLLVYVIVRLIAVPLTMRLSGDALVASIAEQGKRLETLRAMQTIKVMGAETQRETDWLNRFAETIRTGQANALASLGFSSVQGVADALGNVAIIYLGASAIINNEMTVGVLYAFMAYKSQFGSRSQSLFETFVNWRLLDIHSERIADIALTPVEEGINHFNPGLPEMKGAIEFSGLSFRYSPTEPFIFQGLAARIPAGQFVAIVGPSGAGKSTLVKVLCGLYPTTAGEIRFDGISARSWGPRALRSNLGVVLQDDELISGTIAENVAFFAEDIDMDWVWECLATACLDTDVRSMPMRTETFVGDMGSALSGGQKQRLLIARALYRRPKIIVLDEATSHLDLARERVINRSLQGQSVTRIVVAHRPETIAAADRVLILDNGKLSELQQSTQDRPAVPAAPASAPPAAC